MKKTKILSAVILATLFSFYLTACHPDTSARKPDDIKIVQEDDKTHFLRFRENNAEVLRIVVLENETYNDLLPYFPTLDQEEGWIKWWDGDYTYTDYSIDHQFEVYNSSMQLIDICAYRRKVSL